MDLSEQLKDMIRWWEAREARPRIACSDCQFEYVEEEGHTCGKGKIPQAQAITFPDETVG